MLEVGPVQISDPTPQSTSPPSWVAKLAPQVRNPADLVFVRLSLLLTGIFLPLSVVLYLPSLFTWWLAPVYWGLYLFFLGPFVLMVHNTSHRALFTRDHPLANKYIPWVVGLFFGQSPETYFSHHIGMHHAEGNLPNDLSSTMRFQRDSFADFMRYYLRFVFLGAFELVAYLRSRRRHKLARRFIVGEVFYFALAAGLMFVSWRATLVVFVVPLVLTRFLLMAGNWTQHAFVDPDHPDDDLRSVTTFINSHYNHRAFNDGYHVGHHLKPGLHWLDHPAYFAKTREQMIEARTLVFRKIDYFQIWLLLMFKQHRRLARYFVNLDPERALSEDEVVALIKRRLVRFEPEALARYAKR
ncbi:MAG: fatty acid desaturase [Proteobacteria bacterium]|nr:MAG: fatty acid desaturase [Pseudomonadota bacterium]